MPSTTFNFTSGVVADNDPFGGPSSIQATQTIGSDTLTVALDSASGAEALVMDEVAYFGADIANLNGAIFATTNATINTVTLSLDGGKLFDLTSISICDPDFRSNVTLIFTTTKGSVQATIDSSSGAVVVPFSDPILQGVTSVVITPQGASMFIALDDIKVDNITLPNPTPAFVGAGTTLTVTQNSSAAALASLLHVSDTDSGQTETWTQFSAPSHGILTITGATAASGSTDITPGGAITYTPAAGFAGVDSFTVQVSDGTTTATRAISVNVRPATPGAPDLAASSDSGASTSDNITNAASLSFSGASAAGDSASSVRVFLDKNANGVFDAGTDPTATATVAGGSWTVSGLSTSGVSDGDYNVYAQVTSAAGGLTSALSSALVAHLDTTAPTQTLSGLLLSADTGIGSSDFVTKTAAQTVSATLSAGLGAHEALYGSLDGGSTWTDISAKVSGTSLSWNGVTLSGSNTLKLRVGDTAGNTGVVTSHAYTLDTSAPNAPSAPDLTAATDTGASDVDDLTNNRTPVFTGTAESGATVTLYDSDGVTVLGTVTSTGGSWSITAASLGDGAHTLTAKATDLAGNVSAASAGLTAYIDTTASLAITSSASTLKIGETAIITFSFSDDPGASFGWDGASGDVVVSGGTLSALSGTGHIRTAMFTPSAGVNAGTASITAAAGSYADAAGNDGAAGASPSLSFDTLAPSAPSVPALAAGSDHGASSADNITNLATPVLVGTAEAGATVDLYDGASLLGTTTADAGGNWSVTTAPLGEGAHTLTATTVDAAGNASAAGSGVAVTIDTTAPTAVITAGSTSLHVGETTTLTFSFSEPVSGFTNADLMVDNGVLSQITSTDGGTTWTATLTPSGNTLASVNHVVLDNSGVQDVAGNAGTGTTASPSYAIDTTPPPGPTPTGPTPPAPPAPPASAVITVETPDGNIVTGDAQANTINSSGGADTVSAGGGDDTIIGGDYDDVLQGNTGNDSIAGGAGADVAYGGQGNDRLQGNTGADLLFGDKGADTVLGGQGADTLQGGEGADYVSGDLGDDVVRGGKDDDLVFGGGGDDFLSGDLGSDTLTGGAGADVFHSFGAAGLDLVTDFNRAEGDRVMLDPGTSYAATQAGGDVHIDMVGGGQVILAGVQLSTLAGDWIVA